MKKRIINWKILIYLGFSVILLGQKKATFEKSNKYPVIIDVSGSVFITGRDDKKHPAKKGLILVERAKIETDVKSKIVIGLDEFRRAYIEQNSVIDIPSISWESGEAAYFDLKQGSFRWSQDPRNKESYAIFLRSSLFNFRAPPGNYVLLLKPEIPLASLKVLSGQVEFAALNSDESALIKENEKIEFKGILESGEIVYDILLKGKKIPRGALSKVEKLTHEEMDQYSLERERKELEEENRRIQRIKAQKRKIEENQICHHPNGRFNQCVWICEGNPKNEKKICRLDLQGVQCSRKRCDGNGQWSDRQILTKANGASSCKVNPVIDQCDY